MESLLGPSLRDNAESDVPTSALRGKVVALYFSASWCANDLPGLRPLAFEAAYGVEGAAGRVVLAGGARVGIPIAGTAATTTRIQAGISFCSCLFFRSQQVRTCSCFC